MCWGAGGGEAEGVGGGRGGGGGGLAGCQEKKQWRHVEQVDEARTQLPSTSDQLDRSLQRRTVVVRHAGRVGDKAGRCLAPSGSKPRGPGSSEGHRAGYGRIYSLTANNIVIITPLLALS